MSLARIGLLFVNADTQAATRLLRDLFPNPINCACGGRSDLKEPGIILGKQRSASVLEDSLGHIEARKQYFLLEYRSHSSVNVGFKGRVCTGH